jgi:hypothetical protein
MPCSSSSTTCIPRQRWASSCAIWRETFVHPQRFTGTVYQVRGWTKLGVTAGWGRTGEGQDYYLPHGHPKQLWVWELAKGAVGKLRAPELPTTWRWWRRRRRRERPLAGHRLHKKTAQQILYEHGGDYAAECPELRQRLINPMFRQQL